MSVRVARLGDVCEMNPRAPKVLADDELVSFLPMAGVSENGCINFEEERAAGEVKKGYTYFERGDVLVAKITPCFENGKAARTTYLSNPIGFGSTEFHVLRAGREIDSSYLFHLIWNSKLRELGTKNMTGSAGQKRVPADFLKRLEVPLPPLDEQRRIAAILDKADALRRQRRRAIEIGECLSSSAFREMFGRSLGLPEVSLAELIDPDDKINYGVVQPGDNDPDGVFLVRVSDLQNGKVSHAQLRKVACEVSNKHRRSLLLGYEILISCVGSTGGIAVATEAEKGFNVARAVARVPIKDRVLRDYVAEYLRSSSVQEYFRKELRTVSQPTLNIKQISETRIPLAPIARMQAFVQQAETIRGLQEDAAAAATRQDALFKSLQQRAFSGRF
ncbi:restriction endonuclease subunit S [Bradyrhizobium sp. SZCCHNR1015]|uniref:restriction endonuclease subunit S n=1 Tax=Bradyrhizobium sp. SZCCHNR1015 TaxID=3057338 RepID=UPI002916D16B|nr:restriction endonuclease subunit S [Bradyrhizobium sp. SZCCHNR1015]